MLCYDVTITTGFLSRLHLQKQAFRLNITSDKKLWSGPDLPLCLGVLQHRARLAGGGGGSSLQNKICTLDFYWSSG